MPPTERSTVTLVVARSDGGASRFEVPVPSPHSRVLDLLLHVQRHQDPTLGFRFSCRVGMCGSCAMLVNGREAFVCDTSVGSLDSGTVELAPLRALPVQQDLKVDMQPFFDAQRSARAAFEPGEPDRRDIRSIPPGDQRRASIEAQNGCITCGSCHSASAWTRDGKSRAGPAALNRIYMLANDERDRLGARRLAIAAGEAGLLRCHAEGDCETVCPAGVPLQAGLRKLLDMVGREQVLDEAK